jgi:hypothetical protein
VKIKPGDMENEKQLSVGIEKDKEILVAMVKDMTGSTTGAQSTKDWTEDALWFNIPPFASKGIPPALKMFDTVF